MAVIALTACDSVNQIKLRDSGSGGGGDFFEDPGSAVVITPVQPAASADYQAVISVGEPIVGMSQSTHYHVEIGLGAGE